MPALPAASRIHLRSSLTKRRRRPLCLQRVLLAIATSSGGILISPVFANASHSPHARARAHGSVDVFYAGSLVATMTKIAPLFERATGYTFVGLPGGSTALANEIKGKTQKADVFISAGTAANALLTGATNGNWENWYAEFGSTPLVLGYNAKSHFAHDLKTEPWYDVVTKPGFRLGRTDPTTDPKGVLSVTALKDAAKISGHAAVGALVDATNGIFPEETLVGRLQAGQLDAGFFYGVEAAAANLKSVTLLPVKLTSPYTIAEINRAPHAAAATAFIAFLLGPKGAAILRREGLTLQSRAVVHGKHTAVPAALKRVVSSS